MFPSLCVFQFQPFLSCLPLGLKHSGSPPLPRPGVGKHPVHSSELHTQRTLTTPSLGSCPSREGHFSIPLYLTLAQPLQGCGSENSSLRSASRMFLLGIQGRKWRERLSLPQESSRVIVMSDSLLKLDTEKGAWRAANGLVLAEAERCDDPVNNRHRSSGNGRKSGPAGACCCEPYQLSL